MIHIKTNIKPTSIIHVCRDMYNAPVKADLSFEGRVVFKRQASLV